MKVVLFALGVLTGMLIPQFFKGYLKVKSGCRLNRMSRMLELVDSSKDVIYHYQLKPRPKYLYVSPSIEDLLGPELLEASYQNPKISFNYIHPEDRTLLLKKMEGKVDFSKPILQRWRDHTGNYKWCEEYATPIYKKGELVAIVGYIRDITDKVEMQQELQYLSTHDILTGLYNRNYFEKIMERYNNEIDCPIALILCDLDELKGINDTFGHVEGDKIIKTSAKMIHEFFSENTTVARIGGDEFVIILPNQTSSQVEMLCKEFEAQIADFNEKAKERQLGLSLGYSSTERSIGNMDNLLTQADIRMYQNKNDKKQKQLVINR
ncbi:diguanylate cyclase domain-containing protein [Sporosarcina soli]|uniref:Diguanylate cyclase domain-containing protein n=1 Tax=Sporosarcina soli TaxID=334736 RepID=A0ABW0TJC7_9BACL